MSKIEGDLPNQLQTVLQRIEAATLAAARPAHSVCLLAVSKTYGLDAVLAAARCGQSAFGENYVQEAVEKIVALRAMGNTHLQWHMIGPLQSNKTRLVAEHFDWVQTVDRLKLAQRLSEQRPAHLAPLQVCIQVNVDAAQTKSGVVPSEVLELARAVSALPRLQLRGLMFMPDAAPNFVAAHAMFARATGLFSSVKQAEPGWPQWDTLSMGMSADIEAAVQAGSTMVRVGTAIFGARS